MCCFSRPVKNVSSTNIFCRLTEAGDQFVVYSMRLKATEDLAMVLPIPSDRNKGEKAVRFVDLSGYPDFFGALDTGFPKPVAQGFSGGSRSIGKRLEVVSVGSFDASFVPTTQDFERLDERFRLPDGTWEKLGDYAKFGFVVFKLRKGDAKIHPMAFRFASAKPRELFFPTVHVHDGKVHPQADFDHVLYCQVNRPGVRALTSWQESGLPASRFVNVSETKGTVVADQHVFQYMLAGTRKNEDVKLAIG